MEEASRAAAQEPGSLRQASVERGAQAAGPGKVCLYGSVCAGLVPRPSVAVT